MAFAIHERELRDRLYIRAKPYFVRIGDGIHLGYRRGKSVSRWVVRWRRNGGYRTRTMRGVETDDHLAPDGVHVLNFQQVVNRIMSECKSKLGCSFCGKSREHVARLVAGPGVFICNECVAMCQLYMGNTPEDSKLLEADS